MKSLLVPAILFLQSTFSCCELCPKSPNTHQNSKLTGYVIKTFQPVPTKEDCAEACTFNRICLSVNFYEGNRTCELNNSSHLLVPGKLLRVPGSEYIAVVIVTPEQKQKCSNVSLGMEDYRIENSSITASSEYINILVARGARLNADTFWAPASKDQHQWIQVKFVTTVTIFAIATQGASNVAQWVTKYIVKYGYDDVNLVAYDNGRLIGGNTNQHVPVKNEMKFMAKVVRINPREWQWFPAMRLELYGCADCSTCIQ